MKAEQMTPEAQQKQSSNLVDAFEPPDNQLYLAIDSIHSALAFAKHNGLITDCVVEVDIFLGAPTWENEPIPELKTTISFDANAMQPPAE